MGSVYEHEGSPLTRQPTTLQNGCVYRIYSQDGLDCHIGSNHEGTEQFTEQRERREREQAERSREHSLKHVNVFTEQRREERESKLLFIQAQ